VQVTLMTLYSGWISAFMIGLPLMPAQNPPAQESSPAVGHTRHFSVWKKGAQCSLAPARSTRFEAQIVLPGSRVQQDSSLTPDLSTNTVDNSVDCGIRPLLALL